MVMALKPPAPTALEHNQKFLSSFVRISSGFKSGYVDWPFF
jgi:hypothetical protein